jgi:hypothetical protein
VFVPESGVAENACVARDVLEAWHIGEQSALFRAMTAKDGASGGDGGRPGTAPAAMGGAVGGAVGPGANAENRPPRAYLEEMMGAMVEASNATSCTMGTQTDTAMDSGQVLDRRLRRVHDDYVTRCEEERLRPAHMAEERMIVFQGQCNARAREEIDAEVQRFQQTELKRVKLEEGTEYRRRLEGAEARLRAEYDDKFRQMRDRESLRMAESQRREAEIENERYDHRQRVLGDADKLRDREMQISRGGELERRHFELERARMQDMERGLRTKHDELDRLRGDLERAARQDKEAFEGDVRRGYEARENMVRSTEAKLKDDVEAFTRDRERYDEKVARVQQAELVAREASAAAQEAEGAVGNLTLELKRTRDQSDIVGAAARTDHEALHRQNKELEELRRQLSDVQQRMSDDGRKNFRREQEQEQLTRTLGERVADMQAMLSRERQEHAEVVRALRDEPQRAVGKATESFRWQENEWARERHQLCLQNDALEESLEDLQTRVEAAEGKERVARQEANDLGDLLQQARIATNDELRVLAAGVRDVSGGGGGSGGMLNDDSFVTSGWDPEDSATWGAGGRGGALEGGAGGGHLLGTSLASDDIALGSQMPPAYTNRAQGGGVAFVGAAQGAAQPQVVSALPAVQHQQYQQHPQHQHPQQSHAFAGPSVSAMPQQHQQQQEQQQRPAAGSIVASIMPQDVVAVGGGAGLPSGVGGVVVPQLPTVAPVMPPLVVSGGESPATAAAEATAATAATAAAALIPLQVTSQTMGGGSVQVWQVDTGAGAGAKAMEAKAVEAKAAEANDERERQRIEQQEHEQRQQQEEEDEQEEARKREIQRRKEEDESCLILQQHHQRVEEEEAARVAAAVEQREQDARAQEQRKQDALEVCTREMKREKKREKKRHS